MSRSARRCLVLCGLVALLLGAPALAAPTSGDQAFDEGLQWGLTTIRATDAWSRGRGAGITIAIVDSGVRTSHDDLESKIDGGIACIDTGGDPRNCRGAPVDDDGHGTHVAGIAAAVTGNQIGVAGTAPDARILAVKVLAEVCDPTGCESRGSASDVSAGIRWAVDQGADIVNLSLGSTTQAVLGPSFADAVDYAWDRGAIAVVAAGNDFVLTSGFADQPAVVVTATDRADRPASYSNGVGEARWAVAAPGGEVGDTATSCASGGAPKGVLSTWGSADDAYACLAGTSMAAPHVSGALAVLRGIGLSPQQAVDVLLETTVDLGTPGRDDNFGEGRIDLAAATTAAVGLVGSGPPPTTKVTTRPTTTSAPAPTTAARPSGTATSPPTTQPPTSGTAPSSTVPSDDDAQLGGGTTTSPPSVDVDDAVVAGGLSSIQDEPPPSKPLALVLAATAGVVGTGAATASALLRGRTAA